MADYHRAAVPTELGAQQCLDVSAKPAELCICGCGSPGICAYHVRDNRENDVPMRLRYHAAKMKLLWCPKQDSIEDYDVCDESNPLNGESQVLVPFCSYVVGC